MGNLSYKNKEQEFNAVLLKGKYLFHVHTNYADGSSTVSDYFEYASRHQYESIIFTEHVRQDISYDFDNFLHDIKTAGSQFPKIKSIIGAEAKILPDGDVDVPSKILSKIRVLCFACHSFPKDIDLYESSLKNAFADKRWKKFIRIWVHPGRFLKRNGCLEDNTGMLADLIDLAVRENIFIEKNLRDDLPPASLLENIPDERIVTGYDAHSAMKLPKGLPCDRDDR